MAASPAGSAAPGASPAAAEAGARRAGSDGPLLEPRLLARLQALALGTRRRLVGALAGEHRSTRHGSSLDFADERQYHPGDDFRRIDYNLLARLDQVMVKLYEADDDLHVRILVDTSASMDVAASPGPHQASGPSKLRQAARVAASLGFVALLRRDSVSVHTFPLDRPAPRFVGPGSFGNLMAHLSRLEAGGSTDFAHAVADLLARPGPRGLTVVVSDLLTPEWEAGLRRLPARGGDVVVVHVLAGDDLHPQVVGDVDLVDSETGASVAVSLSPTVLEEYEKLAQAWIEEVAGRCRQAGAGYVRLMADEDLEQALLGAWRKAGVLR